MGIKATRQKYSMWQLRECSHLCGLCVHSCSQEQSRPPLCTGRLRRTAVPPLPRPPSTPAADSTVREVSPQEVVLVFSGMPRHGQLLTAPIKISDLQTEGNKLFSFSYSSCRSSPSFEFLPISTLPSQPPQYGRQGGLETQEEAALGCPKG